MSCKDCPPAVTEREPQTAVRFAARMIGGRVVTGHGPADWSEVPDDGILAVVLVFNDSTRRNCNGDDWYGLLVTGDRWTVIHNSHSEAENRARYPNVAWKRGRWTDDGEMQAVLEWMATA
jgi:hypothetical protein